MVKNLCRGELTPVKCEAPDLANPAIRLPRGISDDQATREIRGGEREFGGCRCQHAVDVDAHPFRTRSERDKGWLRSVPENHVDIEVGCSGRVLWILSLDLY